MDAANTHPHVHSNCLFLGLSLCIHIAISRAHCGHLRSDCLFLSFVMGIDKTIQKRGRGTKRVGNQFGLFFGATVGLGTLGGDGMGSKGGPWGAGAGGPPGGPSAGASANHPYHHQGPNPFHQAGAPGNHTSIQSSRGFCFCFQLLPQRML